MPRLVNLLKKEWLRVTLLLILFLSLINTPLTIRILQTPPDRYYLGAEKFYPDYHAALGIMSLGANGSWVMIDPDTGKNTNAFLYHIEYFLMGKIAKFFNIPSPIFYHATRILVQALIFLCFYKLTFLLGFKKNARLASLLVAFFLAAPPLIDNFYRPHDNISLFTQTLHPEMGLLGALTSFVLLLKFLKTKNLINLFFLLLALFLTSVVQSAQSVLLVFTLFFTVMFIVLPHLGKYPRELRLPQRNKLVKYILFLLAIALAISLPTIIFKISFSMDSTLTALGTDFEKKFAETDFKAPFTPILASFIYYLSPFAFLSFLIKKAFKNLSQTQKLASLITLSYILSYIFLFFVGFYFLGVSRARFSVSLWPQAFAILIGLSLCPLSKKAILVFISAVFLFSIPSYIASIKKDTFYGPYPKLNEYIYPRKDLINAVIWMRNLPKNSKVISIDYSGEYFMGLGNVLPYINSQFYTINSKDKGTNVQYLFTGRLSQNEAKKFLAGNHIKYVFVGPYEYYEHFDMASYPFLKKIYQNPQVTIYEFQP